MKKKFDLKSLKVNSFITDVTKISAIKGGKPPKSENTLNPNNNSWACCP